MFIDTVFAIGSKVDIILHLVRASADAHITSVDRRNGLDHRLVPVGIRESPRVASVLKFAQFVVGIRASRNFVQHRSIFECVTHLGELRRGGVAVASVECHDRFSFFASFGRDQDDSVGRPRTVNRSCGVFQY